MNHDEKQIVLSCANLLDTALDKDMPLTKREEIIRSVTQMLRAV